MIIYTELYKIIKLNLSMSSGNMIESRGQFGQKKWLRLGMNWDWETVKWGGQKVKGSDLLINDVEAKELGTSLLEEKKIQWSKISNWNRILKTPQKW